MKKEAHKQSLNDIVKSKFVRTIFIQTISIFSIVIIAIIAIVFFSFTSEINKNLISERQKHLNQVENTISRRISEVSSIAYHIGNEKTFLLEPVNENNSSGYEMSEILQKYLVGNEFIEYLAYYRLSEPDIIYTSKGELAFKDFLSSYLKLDENGSTEYINSIKSTKKINITYQTFKNSDDSFFAYICPLPQFSQDPQAYVLVLIPGSEVEPILEAQLSNCYGQVAIFNADGEELYSVSNLDESIPIDLSDAQTEKNFFSNGKKYVMHTVVSEENNWTYVSVIRLNDIISETANKQVLFIIMLMILMIVALFSMLFMIIVKYKPINKLAMTLSDKNEDNTVIDEQSLLSDTFAVLKDDSEQKQKFETAYYEAEAANKAKSAFLSNMSHDIRTPMNAIVGMTEIALKHADKPDYVKDCLQKVRVASQYLLDIINNVLDMSRIESGKFKLSEDEIDFPKLVYGMITILNQSLDVKSQKLIVEVNDIANEKVIGDTVRLTQVFMNILSNSVKFTPNGGEIRFLLSQDGITDDGYGDYTFVFSDNGVGMSEEFTKKVFDTFTRDEKASIAKIEGTGLGMAIAKSFVELMGGTIKCESELGKGTTFTVKMHMKLVQTEPAVIDYEKNRNTSVLILGTDKQICDNQIKRFTDLGAKVELAHYLGEALNKAAQAQEIGKPYDFVIINQSEDDKNGINTVTQLNKLPDAKNMTYILAARNMLSIERSTSYNAGVAAFIQVPMFKSSALGILNRTFEPCESAAKKTVVNLEGIRVLLVEDNQINRQIARSLIGETKATVIEATNGKEAVDLFKQHEAGYFNVILMDVQMPIMNGYEATAAIRSIQREDAASIPIYAMTANTFDEDVRQVKEAGMNGHLGKPYVSEELYKLIEQAV